MKLWKLPAFLLLASTAFCDSTTIQFKGGLNVDDSPAVLVDQTPDSENVISDYGQGLRSRLGYVSQSTQTCSNLWEFPHSNGTRYLICQDTSDNKLKQSTDGVTFNTLVSTVAASITTVGSVLGDHFYFSNTADGLKSWDSATLTVVDLSLGFSQLVTHKARLWGCGKPSATRTIYGSKFGDGTNFTLVTDPAATDPTQIVVGGALDEPLTALYASFQDRLIWMKSHSFGAITGDSRTDFAQKVYSDKIGTAYSDSIKDCDGYLRWLGPARTIWEYDGNQLMKISKGVDGLLATVAQGDANQRSYGITTQSDFNAGTNYQTSNSISPGDVVLSTWSKTDTTNPDFGAGTFVNTSSITDSVYLSTNDTNLINFGFESASGGISPYWTESGASPQTVAGGLCTPYNGTYYETISVSVSESLTAQVLDASGSLLQSTSFGSFASFSACTWSQKTIDLSAYAGRQIKIKLLASGGSFATSDTFLCSGNTMSFRVTTETEDGITGVFQVDYIIGGRSTIFSGTFTSAAFNTSLSSAAWSSSDSNFTTNGNAISFQTQSSSDGSSWQTAVDLSTGSSPASDFRQYIRYVVTLSTGGTTNGTALPHVDDVTLSARANYGTYHSVSIPLGSISSWGAFGATSDTNGGVISYALYTDTDNVKTITNGVPYAGSYVSSQTITNGGIPVVSTAAYAFIGETFTVDAGTETPTNHDLTLNWAQGLTLRVAGVYTNQRYWLGCAINSTTNNRVLVYDRNHQWQRYSGINMAVANLYTGNLIFSNASGTWQGETGYKDNGAAIASYFTTPTLSPASPNLSSDFNDFQVTTDNSAETLATTYYVNGVSTSYNLGSYTMNTASGIQNRRLPFPYSQIQQGRNLSLKVSVTGSTFWRLLGATLDFTPDKVPQ